jgi:hypothetical protein
MTDLEMTRRNRIQKEIDKRWTFDKTPLHSVHNFSGSSGVRRQTVDWLSSVIGSRMSYYLQRLSETFVILRTVGRDTKNVRRSSRTVPVIRVLF